MDTPRGYQGIGGKPTIGPYSSATACEEVNRRSFGGQGRCRLQSRSQEPPKPPEAVVPPPPWQVPPDLRDAPGPRQQPQGMTLAMPPDVPKDLPDEDERQELFRRRQRLLADWTKYKNKCDEERQQCHKYRRSEERRVGKECRL